MMCKFVIAAEMVKSGMEYGVNTITTMTPEGTTGHMLITADCVNVIDTITKKSAASGAQSAGLILLYVFINGFANENFDSM